MIKEEYNISDEGMKMLLYMLRHPSMDNEREGIVNRSSEESEMVEFEDLDLSFIDKT